MPVKCQTIINFIEQLVPRRLAEDWDNVGLQIGDRTQEIRGIVVALDLEPQVVDEALAVGANLIITHHPVIFKPLKNIRADLTQGKMILNIIKNDISVYCAHTNLDSAAQGVNQVLAELLKLEKIKVLNPDKAENLFKVVIFVPESHLEPVRSAMAEAGAGWIGNYSDCSFFVRGTGAFKATPGCSPFTGEVGTLEQTPEVRLETIVTEKQINKVVKAAIAAHPYEEAAYDVYPLANHVNELGLGRVGDLRSPVSLVDFMELVKNSLNVSTVKYTGDSHAIVRKIAVCGGSGAGLIHKAAFAGVDVLLTGDVKYHEAQEAKALGLNLVDAGHFATEYPVVLKLADLLANYCSEEGYGIPVHSAQMNTDIFSFY
jgi:dinuclear metal center YbgI/SA1388 family protein